MDRDTVDGVGTQTEPPSNLLALNGGSGVVSLGATYRAVYSNPARTLYNPDEAVQHRADNIRAMEADVLLQECIERRVNSVAMLPWEIVPEDEDDQEAKRLAHLMTASFKRVRQFTELRKCLALAFYYGRYAVQFFPGWELIGDRVRFVPQPRGELPGWSPIHGDKLVFRSDVALQEGQQPHELGVRVSSSQAMHLAKDGRFTEMPERPSESGDTSQVVMLTPEERRLLVVHKCGVRDGQFDDWTSAGAVHGVGLRSKCYWYWLQKNKLVAEVVEALHRNLGGIEIHRFLRGNTKDEDEARKAAAAGLGRNGRASLLSPVVPGEEPIEPSIDPGATGGVDAMLSVIHEFYEVPIKRLFLGQTLTSEAGGTGLGSNLAAIHLDTFQNIVAMDAACLSETITKDMLRVWQLWEFPQSSRHLLHFRIKADADDPKELMEAVQAAVSMGVEVPEEFVRTKLGIPAPKPGQRILGKPQGRE